MKNDYTYLVSLDEVCTNQKLDDKQRENFRDMVSMADALLEVDGRESISALTYLKYWLEVLESGIAGISEAPLKDKILAHDILCRGALDECIALSAAILRQYASDHNFIPDNEGRIGLSEFVSVVTRVAEHFIIAQHMLVNSPLQNRDSLEEVENP